MRTRFPNVLAILAAVVLMSANMATAASKFEGAWFEVQYPDAFKATPSQQSSTADGFDSAFFAAPDKTVEFYVFSPQWGGDPADIALDPATETLADERIVKNGEVTKRWYTIAAKDGSYKRSYLSVLDERGPTNWTIGRKYASEADRLRYNAEYLSFRDSLTQFAD